jgi:hypothetical protein
VCSGGVRAFRTSVVIMYSAFSALTSPHHKSRKVLKKYYFEVTTEKYYKERNLLSFVVKNEVNLHVMEERIVSIL